MAKTVRIGTRKSKLAVIQAELVASAIRAAHPEIEIELVKITTTGDQILDKTLDQIGGKGLFVKELDQALLRGEVDICVHSYKDMPMEDNPELPVVAVSEREDARDVLVLPAGVDQLDPAKPVGCCSSRRQVQLAELYPGARVQPVRGNVLTRLEKLDSGAFSALILAAAGLKRLGLWPRVSRAFETGEMIPAVCQGILAVQGRVGEDYSYLSGYNSPESVAVAAAERAFVRALGIGCGGPVGVFAQIDGEALTLRGMRGEGGVIHRAQIIGDRARAQELGEQLAQKIQLAGDL
ncbi:MAG: hydroxymethylbilane synthase [Oscillospiraceae bacterium]|nr:hydroxymethylbilane synthase [Oscillospiraceae bacterium]